MLIVLVDGDHAARRKRWDKAFGMAALKSYQPAIYKRLEVLVKKLDDIEGQAFDLHRWMGFFVYDVMTDLAYSGGQLTELLTIGS